MSLTSEAMRLLAERGLTIDDIIAVAAANELPGQPERRALKATSGKPGAAYPDNWIELRDGIIERDGFQCAYCEDHDGETLTADHVVPLTRGGSNDPVNLVCCCLPCNNSKRNLLICEWPGRGTTRRHRPFDHLIGASADA